MESNLNENNNSLINDSQLASRASNPSRAFTESQTPINTSKANVQPLSAGTELKFKKKAELSALRFKKRPISGVLSADADVTWLVSFKLLYTSFTIFLYI